jgi:hypothetical protein
MASGMNLVRVEPQGFSKISHDSAPLHGENGCFVRLASPKQPARPIFTSEQRRNRIYWDAAKSRNCPLAERKDSSYAHRR